VPLPPAALDTPLTTVPDEPLVPLFVPLRPLFIAVLPEPLLTVPAFPEPALALSPPEFNAVLPVALLLLPASALPVERTPEFAACWLALAAALPFGISLFAVVLAPPVALFGFIFMVPPEPLRLDEPAFFACWEPAMLQGECCVGPVFSPELVPVPVPSADPVPVPLLDAPALEPAVLPLPLDCASAIPPLSTMLSAVAAARTVRFFIKDSLVLPPANSGCSEGFLAADKRAARDSAAPRFH
jgi:hypothetical protein